MTRANDAYLRRVARSSRHSIADIIADLIERSRVADAAGIGPYVNIATNGDASSEAA